MLMKLHSAAKGCAITQYEKELARCVIQKTAPKHQYIVVGTDFQMYGNKPKQQQIKIMTQAFPD